MFGNTPEMVKEDQRGRRTRDRLGDAMFALLTEKPFDDITVQDVLDRAQVSRSTFYTHYRDKNDLFLSDAEEFFEAMATSLSRHGEQSDRVAPVRELFAHIAEVRPFYNALIASGRSQDLLELGQGHFARGIEQRFNELSRAGAIPTNHRSAIAHALSGSLFSLLTWWIHHPTSSSAEKMDELFHELVWNGISPRNPKAADGEGKLSDLARQSNDCFRHEFTTHSRSKEPRPGSG